MPSRLIHYVLANQIMQQIPMRNTNRFRIGSVCLDLARHDDGGKALTHQRLVVDGRKGYDWNHFVEVYGDKMREDDLYLGAFCHLITDAIWCYRIFDPTVRQVSRTREEVRAKSERCYEDFHRLNYILTNENLLSYEIEEDRDIDIEGVKVEYYDYFFREMQKDFHEPEASKEDLEVYSYDYVGPFFEEALAICVQELRNFLEGKEIMDARRYFLSIIHRPAMAKL